MHPSPEFVLPEWPEPADMTFNAPLAVVNAELFAVLRLWAAQIGRPLLHRQTVGAVGYTVRLPSGRELLFDVLERAEELTTVRFTYPWHFAQLLVEEAQRQGPVPASTVIASFDREQEWYRAVIHRCTRQIVQAMRYRQPGFMLDPEVFAPPMPQWDSYDRQLQRDCILWKDLYKPGMPDREFAARLGIDYGTLRNARTHLNLPVRRDLAKVRRKSRACRDNE